MVAAELGIGVDDVRVMQGDTDLCPLRLRQLQQPVF